MEITKFISVTKNLNYTGIYFVIPYIGIIAFAICLNNYGFWNIIEKESEKEWNKIFSIDVANWKNGNNEVTITLWALTISFIYGGNTKIEKKCRIFK